MPDPKVLDAAYETMALTEAALGAVFAETDENWAERRWLAEESIAQASASTRPATPTPTYENTAEEQARRIIDIVVADNPIGRRAA